MDRNELMRMFVLDVIADDYEDLAMIYREAGKNATDSGLTATTSEIKQALLDLIRMDLARAYRLSSTRPAEEILGAPSSDEIEKCYFYLTESGRKLQLADYADWPFDETGALRKDWSPPAG